MTDEPANLATGDDDGSASSPPDAQAAAAEPLGQGVYNTAEAALIAQRLEDLGYID